MNASYPEQIKKLFAVNLHGAVKSGLVNMQRLNDIFGCPNQYYKSVHVAGTNGKGSVTIKIGKGLMCAGNRVGVFTSPHIESFCERIQINGNQISETDVSAYLTQIFEAAEKNQIPATFFEITTMIALKYFADHKVDWAVFETGLGGRFDATNILTPKLSVITSISLDHTQHLGSTLEMIAQEKAGIIKADIPVILGPNTPFIPRKKPFYEVHGNFETTEQENRAIAKMGLDVLGIELHPEALEASLPCRMERHQKDGVNLILDVAHNPDGLERLMKTLRGTPLRIVFGMCKTKDLAKSIEIIKNYSRYIYIVAVPEDRGYSVEELARAFGTHPTIPCVSILAGVFQAIQDAKATGETVLVCGSCYIMKDAKLLCSIKGQLDFVHQPKSDI